MGELEEVAQQCDMSVDELEQWTLWQGPEVGYYQTLDKKRITSSLLFSNGMRESGPSCQSKTNGYDSKFTHCRVVWVADAEAGRMLGVLTR